VEDKKQDIFMPLLSVAFIVLKLCKVIEWNWLWVLCPIWGPLAISFFAAVWVAIRRADKK
jgi:hypothetical protein